MKTHAIVIALIVAMCAMLAMPRQTYAGDDEWATAGKIQAGVVGLRVLQKGVRSGGHRDYEHGYAGHEHSRHHYKRGRRHDHHRRSYRHRYRSGPRYDYSRRTVYVREPIIRHAGESTSRAFTATRPMCRNGHHAAANGRPSGNAAVSGRLIVQRAASIEAARFMLAVLLKR